MASPTELITSRWDGIKSQSDTSLIRWCVVAIAVIAVWVWVIEPLQIWTNDLHDQVQRNGDRAARLMAIEENADSWIEAAQEANQAFADAQQQLFVTSSDTQAQAIIQGVLQEMALSRNLNIESRKLIPAERSEPVGMRLGVEIGLRGELTDVLQFMDDVSNSQKLFVIDRWIIQMERTKKVFVRCTVAGIRPVEFETETDV